MPTRNISLTAEQDAFVEKLVEAGEYQNASEAVRDALRTLQQRRREDSLKLKALRMHIKAGADALKRVESPQMKVGRPVHILYYRKIQPGLIEIVRVLHERMEPSRHFETVDDDKP